MESLEKKGNYLAPYNDHTVVVDPSTFDIVEEEVIKIEYLCSYCDVRFLSSMDVEKLRCPRCGNDFAYSNRVVYLPEIREVPYPYDMPKARAVKIIKVQEGRLPEIEIEVKDKPEGELL